jgi:hypothetical protein
MSRQWLEADRQSSEGIALALLFIVSFGCTGGRA